MENSIAAMDENQRKKRMDSVRESPTGPEPERLKLDGDWADRVDDALRKKKPADGWPGAKKPGKGKSDKKKSG